MTTYKFGRWYPIESAPKDGTDILLFGVYDGCADDYPDGADPNFEHIEIGRWSVNSGYRPWVDGEASETRRVQTRERYEYESWGTHVLEDPTQWMPLPSPPENEG